MKTQLPRPPALLMTCGSSPPTHERAHAPAQPGFVVFTLPWEKVKTLLPKLADLSGKPIADMTLPGVRPVKTFNMHGAPNIANAQHIGGTTTITLAAADATVQAWVASLVSELDLEPLDTRALVAASDHQGTLRLLFGYLLYSKGRSCEFNLRPVQK